MIKYEELNVEDIEKYDQISFGYKTNKKYKITKINRGLGGFNIKLVDTPYYEKIFDTKTSKWKKYFKDLSNWKIYVAKDNDKLIAGCVIATKTSDCDMLENRTDLAVLWDIRVEEHYQHKNIGQTLFNMALNFCKKEGFKQLKIECQNTNPNAVNFYHKQGAILCGINEYAYPDSPNETQMLWYINL